MRQKPPSSNLLTNQRVKLTVAYDGSDFCGWASQTGQRAVHSTLKEGLCRVIGEEVELWGASRTDGGAHALGQVCHFDCPVSIPIENWPRAMNKLLPTDVSVLKAEAVHPEFNSRFMARKRHYRYRILQQVRDPHRTRFAHYYHRKLDLQKMQLASQKLVGEHNFLAFSQELEIEKNMVRTLFRVSIQQKEDEIVLNVHGTAFVRGMMRRIAGSLLEIGRGQRPVEWIDELLVATDKSSIDWPPVLPACGLTLMKVSYGRNPSDHRFNNRDEQSAQNE